MRAVQGGIAVLLNVWNLSDALWSIRRRAGYSSGHSADTEKPPAECGSEAAYMYLVSLTDLVAGAGFEPVTFRL